KSGTVGFFLWMGERLFAIVRLPSTNTCSPRSSEARPENHTHDHQNPTVTRTTGPPGPMPLTRQQQVILDAILFFIRKGELPTVREVGALVGLRSPATVLKHLRALEQANIISINGKSRGIRLIRSPEPVTDVPLSVHPRVLSFPSDTPRIPLVG